MPKYGTLCLMEKLVLIRDEGGEPLDRYKKFSEYLSQQDKQGQDTIHVKEKELSEIFGFDLPVEAFSNARWWRSSVFTEQGSALIEAGYYVTNAKTFTNPGTPSFGKYIEFKRRKLIAQFFNGQGALYKRVAAIILVLSLLSYLGIKTPDIISKFVLTENDKAGTLLPVTNIETFDFLFPDKPFMAASAYVNDGKYQDAYASISEEMEMYLAALEGVGGGDSIKYANLDPTGAEKCLFYGMICTYLGKHDEAVVSLMNSKLFYDRLINKDAHFIHEAIVAYKCLAESYFYAIFHKVIALNC